MKKSILSFVLAVMLVIMMLTSSAYAANADVTLDKVKEDVCKIDLGGYGKKNKKVRLLVHLVHIVDITALT
mgnify:CR=1 FL=1